MQSPAISFVRVSSPTYWPSNLTEPCAHAALPNPVPSTRLSPSHLSILSKVWSSMPIRDQLSMINLLHLSMMMGGPLHGQIETHRGGSGQNVRDYTPTRGGETKPPIETRQTVPRLAFRCDRDRYSRTTEVAALGFGRTDQGSPDTARRALGSTYRSPISPRRPHST